MALIKCPECEKEISDKAPACVHCGYPLANITNKFDNTEDNKVITIENKPKTAKEREKEIARTKMIIYGCILFVGILLICYITYSVIEEEKKCNKFQCEEYHIEGGKACEEHTCIEDGCFNTVVGNSRYCVKHK